MLTFEGRRERRKKFKLDWFATASRSFLFFLCYLHTYLYLLIDLKRY